MPVRPDSPALPGAVRLETGPGGLEVLRVESPAATAEVHLQGAHVTRWTPAGREPVLFMSERSAFLPGVPIRGGVPICFPWFGAHPAVEGAPAHGFARRVPWRLVDAQHPADDVVLTFRLTDDETTRSSAWPHRFSATYTVTVGRELRLALSVVNTDDVPVSVEAALHTYLAVTDVRAVRVEGLEDQPYVDRGTGAHPGQGAPIEFTAETDRIYGGTTATTAVTGEGVPHTVTVAKEGSRSTVVWNPWSERAAALADLADDEWTRMVCVETCNVDADAVRLEPGQEHTMAAVLRVLPAGPLTP